MSNHTDACPKGQYYNNTAFPDVEESHPDMAAYDAAAPACTCGHDAIVRVRAAAPDMLSALNDARNLIAMALENGAWGPESSDTEDSADEAASVLGWIDDAIAKAEGRS